MKNNWCSILMIFIALSGVLSCKKERTQTLDCHIENLRVMAINIDSTTVEGRVVKLINELRKTEGLPPLLVNRAANEVSLKHLRAIHDSTETLSHDNIDKRSNEIRHTFPCANVGENLAWGPRTADLVVSLWYDSPSHRSNILGDYDFIGVSVILDANGHYYFSNLFVKGEGTLHIGGIID